jgi:4-alpha-glucanotransferase
MKISFNINYRTKWGESLYICGSLPELGAGDDSKAPRLDYLGGETWHLTIDVNDLAGEFDYRYIVKPDHGAWRMEWGDPHRFNPAPGITEAEIYDRWQDQPYDKPYYSSAFIDGMLHRPFRSQPLKVEPGMLNVRVQAPMVGPDEVLAIAGECKALGEWDVKQAVRMNDARFPEWEVNVPLRDMVFPCEYKFLIINQNTGEAVAWEMRNNRVLSPLDKSDKGYATVVAGMRFVNPLRPWKGAGTAIPVFSVRTEDDFGVGDFIDLKKMVDWCVLTGQKVLQLLPVNDTTMTGTWTDSYPYNSNSTFALHPMYLHLQAVGRLKNRERQEHFEQLGKALNRLDAVDYEQVNSGKLAFLRELYAEVKDATHKKEDYRKFVKENGYWLRPYAAFCTLRDLNRTPEMSKWGEYAVYSPEKVDRLEAEHTDEMEFTYFLQYHLDRQLREVRDYAHQKGVVLKGDIPIGISRTSVDAWVYPQLFFLESQAGAPPDDFSIMGQNWGFPTYNWEEMARDGFAWWKSRFRKMSEYFDAYRIDHVLGFFRIWQIPMDAIHGLLGIFSPALPFSPDELRHEFDFWLNPGIQAHPLILEWMLTDFFGGNTETAKAKFLKHVEGDRYELLPFVDTQRKVTEYFASQPENEDNEQLCNGLMGLIDNVLFIEDPVEKGKYHPRIAAQTTYQYRCLNDYERWCFDRLYNDFFYHRHNDFWYGKAMWKLPPLIDSTRMLCCAEDLGMIPDCVPAVMHDLQILSLEIQRMPKDPKVEFGNTWSYPYYSVCTSSTHDMPGIRGWWESDHGMAQRFYNQVLHENGEAPFYAEPWICSRILDLQLDSPSMLCILPLQDWLSSDGKLRRNNPADEQINIPAISRHYWRYRMHLTVEELMKQTDFNEDIARRVKESGR